MQNNFNPNYNKALELYQKGELNQAIQQCEKAINEDQNNYLAWNLLGNIFFNLNDLESSKQFFVAALKIKPDFIEAYYMLGNVLFSANLFEDSISIWKEALTFDQSHAVIYSNIAASYLALKEFDNAITFAEQAIKIDKNLEDAYNCLSKIYMQKNEEKEAFKYLKEAIRINPKNAETNVDLSTVYFKTENYENAFKYYEHRKFLEDKKKMYDFMPFKKFKGQNLKNKSLLIYHEQGFGDNIQFVRFLNNLEDGNISFGIQNSLNRLFSCNFPNIKFLDEIKSTDKFDFMVPIMSLPHFLNVKSVDSKAYLQVNKEDIEKIKEKLNKNKLNIGIVWEGSKTGAFYEEKTLALKDLNQLFSNEKREFYSLQVADFEELVDFPNIINLGKNFDDFYDTAVAISAMDLIISIDTAVAHLAGALGKKCFVLNNETQFDWRWEHKNQKSTWYDSIRVFKYTNINNIIENLDKEIDEL